MAQAPKPPVSSKYPQGIPVARYQGPGSWPAIVAPAPGPLRNTKTGLPRLPPVNVLFHKPRQPGNG